MARNISFSMTTPQFLDGSKDVTRRVGWEHLRVGDLLCAVEKGMGLKKGEKVKRLGTIRVVDVRQEPLDLMTRDHDYGLSECRREGFPNMVPSEFVEFFCRGHRGAYPKRPITRIEFTRFYGAECGSYPNCAGGCGCGCTKEVERSKALVGTTSKGEDHG